MEGRGLRESEWAFMTAGMLKGVMCCEQSKEAGTYFMHEEQGGSRCDFYFWLQGS